jgi:hypothetical protein
MTDFFKSFGAYYKSTDFSSFVCWAFPVGTLLFIWLATTIGVKVFNKRGQMKKIFIINRAWIISSMIAACILISLICFWWSKNFFSNHPYQLPLLVSLTIAMLIPVVALFKLLPYFSPEFIKEITDQPKTANQLNSVIVHTKKAFRRNKLYFLIPVLGFLFLFFYLYKGTNLITLVLDNSGSMIQTTALEALTETFDNLDKNNEIVLTTLNGPNYKPNTNARKSMNDLMKEKKSSNLNAGNVTAFQNPAEAKNAISQITGFECCSPICESIWKSYLFIRETKSNETYKNKLLVVITDGADNYINESLKTQKFFFDNAAFAEYFPAENVFIIDYSEAGSNIFIQKCSSAGCDVYPAENNKQAYLDALDNALQSFKNSWFLIYWTIIIFSLFTIIALLIQPKKMV